MLNAFDQRESSARSLGCSPESIFHLRNDLDLESQQSSIEFRSPLQVRDFKFNVVYEWHATDYIVIVEKVLRWENIV